MRSAKTKSSGWQAANAMFGMEATELTNTPEEPRLRCMLSEAQVLQAVPIGRSTLLRLEKAGKFPRSHYVSPNRRFWYQDEIVSWQTTVDEFNPNRGRGKPKPDVPPSAA